MCCCVLNSILIFPCGQTRLESLPDSEHNRLLLSLESMEQKSDSQVISKVVLALLLVSPSVAAPPFGPYALPLQQEEQPELQDGSLSPVWSSQQVSSADIWDLYHLSTTSSIDELSTSSVEWWPTESSGSSMGSVIAEVSDSTYLPLETDTTGEMMPNLFTKSSDSGHTFSQPITQTSSVSEVVPVQKLTTVISNGGSDKLNFSEPTTVSIKSVPKISVTELGSSVLTASKEVKDAKPMSVSDGSTSLNNTEVSLDPLMDTISSHSQGVDKPIVNVPRLITRELKNNSHNATSLVSNVASHDSVQDNSNAQPLHISPVTELSPFVPPNARDGKSADYIPSPLHLHPLIISTPLPLELVSESSTHQPNEFLRGVLQSYKPGPKISDDGDARLAEEAGRTENDGDSRIVWITHSVLSDRRNLVPEEKDEEIGAGSRPLEDAEMGDSPYDPPESSTVISSKQRELGETPMPSGDFILPNDKEADPEHASHEKGHGKDIPKVTPPILATSSKAVNTTSQTVRSHDNATRSSYIPPMASKSSEVDSSLSNSTEHTNASTFVHETIEKVRNLTLSSKSPTRNKATNVTPAADDLNETTVDVVETTVVPISNRVQAPAPPGSQHGLDAASITGISLGILVFAALIGAVSFVLYRRRFLNKPQTLNDKCSNPDSSGYIDDSTLRVSCGCGISTMKQTKYKENSEEMYSLDNDSFLNSLEAMTIQNYWTDNVKHTKL
ncbi:hypothetical protein C0J52_27946 [Blattella germanica]|nr:hypothetical protein C0J52_27946 [Blattella germanica]